jgi:hypothetical protein
MKRLPHRKNHSAYRRQLEGVKATRLNYERDMVCLTFDKLADAYRAHELLKGAKPYVGDGKVESVLLFPPTPTRHRLGFKFVGNPESEVWVCYK